MRRGQMFRLWLAVYGAHTIAGCGGATAEQTVHQRLSTLVDAERVSQQMPAQISLAFYGDGALVGARDAKRKAMLDKKYGPIMVIAPSGSMLSVMRRDPSPSLRSYLSLQRSESIDRKNSLLSVRRTNRIQRGHISSVFELADFNVSDISGLSIFPLVGFSAQEFSFGEGSGSSSLRTGRAGCRKGRGNTLTFFTRHGEIRPTGSRDGRSQRFTSEDALQYVSEFNCSNPRRATNENWAECWGL